MDNKRTDGLWKGGPWEQPSPGFAPPPPVDIPEYSRPILRPRRRRRRRWPWLVGGAVLIAALALLAPWLGDHVQISINGQFDPPGFSQGGDHGAPNWEIEKPDSTQPPIIPKAETGTGVVLELLPPESPALSYTEIYDKVAPSLVSIQAASPTGVSTGTGVIMTADGYIITNAHVVAGASDVQVSLYDNTVLMARLVGFHAVEDLAVLKVDFQTLIPAQFGDSLLLRIGEPVAAIGDSLGYRSTITDGIISALDREVEVEGLTMTLIQTSAAINFGNSGGALVNQYGQVVGITTVKIVTDDGSAEALGFAIPSRRVKHVVDALIDGREVRTARFGFTVYTFPAEGGGLELMEVEEGSDAHAKGLRPGDVITHVDGQPISAVQDLTRAKQEREPGDLVTLTYVRDGVSHTVDIALIEALPLT